MLIFKLIVVSCSVSHVPGWEREGLERERNVEREGFFFASRKTFIGVHSLMLKNVG